MSMLLTSRHALRLTNVVEKVEVHVAHVRSMIAFIREGLVPTPDT